MPRRAVETGAMNFHRQGARSPEGHAGAAGRSSRNPESGTWKASRLFRRGARGAAPVRLWRWVSIILKRITNPASRRRYASLTQEATAQPALE
jgi:hypothetical protein